VPLTVARRAQPGLIADRFPLYFSNQSYLQGSSPLKRCSLAEIETTMGHEMGHYVVHHVYKDLMFFGIVIFYDHPSGRTRIYAAMRWKAEHLHELKNPLPHAQP